MTQEQHPRHRPARSLQSLVLCSHDSRATPSPRSCTIIAIVGAVFTSTKTQFGLMTNKCVRCVFQLLSVGSALWHVCAMVSAAECHSKPSNWGSTHICWLFWLATNTEHICRLLCLTTQTQHVCKMPGLSCSDAHHILNDFSLETAWTKHGCRGHV